MKSFFAADKQFDFMGKRKLAAIGSAVVVVLALLLIMTRGLNFGIDFTGGTIVEVGYEEPAHLEEIRTALADAGFERAVAQYFGSSTEVLIRIAPREGEDRSAIGESVIETLKAASDGKLDMRRVEFVGPQVGDELREDGGLAVLYALFGILIYVAFRFEYRFSIGSIAALVHDVIITVGFFALTQIEFDLTVLAAVLAVIGYSLNDTIVVFDRIRENFLEMRRGDSVDVFNESINQTLSRTIMTSLSTLIVLIALAVLGGEIIHAFAVALIVGVVVGTYSSIYVAGNAALMLGVSREDLMPPEDEDEELDEIP